MHKISKEIVKIAKLLTSEESINSLDGESNATAKRIVNRVLSKHTSGFFKDDSWRPVHQIFRDLRDLDIQYDIIDTEYDHNENRVPTGKTWHFEITFTNKNGRETVLHGIIRASGAGSIEDPLDRYDLIAYVS